MVVYTQANYVMICVNRLQMPSKYQQLLSGEGRWTAKQA